MKTNNYELFELMPNNRAINKSLVKEIVQSINKIGYVKSRPILCTTDLSIIDGQHRFEACKILGLPIYYEVTELNPQEVMLELNRNQRVWTMLNYVESWASKGVDCYVKLKNFESDYKLGMANSMVVLHEKNARTTKEIQKGAPFNINKRAHDIAEFLLSCKDYISFYKSSRFIESTCILFKKANKDDIKKLQANIALVKQQATVANYLTIFENIINRRKRDKNKTLVLVTNA